MCGIFGAFNTSSACEKEQWRAVLDALRHRGPDDLGVEDVVTPYGSLVLGHTRLSIIDLSGGGHQPMHSADGRWVIVFNGEIYNYRELRVELSALGERFATDSDTEVLLAAWVRWGSACLQRLTGMFAFGVFDRKEQKLTCARDAFGIKPFFYSANNGFGFASELPALLSILDKRPEPNVQRAYDYLVYGRYDDEAATFYKGIQNLLPGHLITVDLANNAAIKIECWHSLSIDRNESVSYGEAVSEVRELFLNNIRLHLRSDVPVGAALSGGLDSSAVVCAMRYLEPDMPIHTFTYVASGTSIDEEYWADRVNDHIGAIPHKVHVTPDELAKDLDDMIRSQGEPFGSTSIYAQYRVFQCAKEAGIKVTLDGQGADEMLAGYSGYPQAYLQSLKDRSQYWQMLLFLWCWTKWPGRTKKQALKFFVAPFIPSWLKETARKLNGQNSAPEWLNLDALKEAGAATGFPEREISPEGRGRRLVEALRQALLGQGLASLLRHGDRNSMRWSIESRVPFLTADLASYLLSLPEEYLISSDGETKHIFRAAMRGIVPDEILDRKDKIGFETPEQKWLNVLAGQIEGWMAVASKIPFLNAEICKQEVAQIISGKKSFSWQAWRLINYCRWWQLQYNESGDLLK